MPNQSLQAARARHWKRTAIGLSALAASGTAAAESARMPAALVYLRDVDPTIVQDIRYATENNFTGQRVAGYEAAECVLQRGAAAALAKVQSDLKVQGLSLKVYDCYRPQRAVSAFVAWTKGSPDAAGRQRFHPRFSRSQLVAQGYIASRSSHSRGVAVDAALVQLPLPEAQAFDPGRSYGDCAAKKEERSPDASLDFGTGFDCFDSRSHTDDKQLTREQAAARSKLVTAMARHGFTNYKREWWHFTFGAGHAGPVFDVPIQGSTGRSEK